MTVTAFPNGISVQDGLELVPDWRIAKHTGAAFDGGTANAHGDYDGTGNPVTLFEVSGVVEVRLFGICNTLLTGASATLSVGVADSFTATAVMLAHSSTATDIDANEVWLDNTPGVLAKALSSNGVIVNNSDIIETAGTANVTAGQIDYYAIWRPISDGATVTAA